MSVRTAHGDTSHCSAATTAFLTEARRNLRLMRQLYGTHGRRYRRLVRQYRAVADEIGCRRPLERLLHPLQRSFVAPPPVRGDQV